MSALLSLAAHSAWNRRFVLSLIVLSIALSTFLLLGIERIRADVRENFSQSVSGTDLIVGARTGSVQLLLYSVFHIGAASNNIRWQSAQAVAQNRAVAWMVPISLGDSHRGFPWVASTRAYFEHFQYGDHQLLRIASGKPFDGVFDLVLGAEVARRLGYKLGDPYWRAPSATAMACSPPMTTPTNLSRSWVCWKPPARRWTDRFTSASRGWRRCISTGLPARHCRAWSVPASETAKHDLTPKNVTAVLLGLKSRAAVFAVQRFVSEYAGEPLMVFCRASRWTSCGMSSGSANADCLR